jgi:hypothetical protein
VLVKDGDPGKAFSVTVEGVVKGRIVTARADLDTPPP